MKIPLAAVTCALAALSPSPVSPPPATQFEAQATGRRVQVMPQLELNPHAAAPAQPVPFSMLRETSASAAVARLNRLDDRVTNLKARADLTARRTHLDVEFEKLKLLRMKVVSALLNLRSSRQSLDAAEQTVAAALIELEQAVEELAGRLDQSDLIKPPRIS